MHCSASLVNIIQRCFIRFEAKFVPFPDHCLACDAAPQSLRFHAGLVSLRLGTYCCFQREKHRERERERERERDWSSRKNTARGTFEFHESISIFRRDAEYIQKRPKIFKKKPRKKKKKAYRQIASGQCLWVPGIHFHTLFRIAGVYVCMYVYIYTYIYIYIYVCVCTCAYICMYICIYIHMYVCVCVSIYTHTHTHTHTHIRQEGNEPSSYTVRLTQKKKAVIQPSLAFPKTFSFELRFWHNFVPDMHDSSWAPILGAPQCKCIST